MSSIIAIITTINNQLGNISPDIGTNPTTTIVLPSLTTSPPPTKTEVISLPNVKVASNLVNMRTRPGKTYDVITTYSVGTIFDVVGRNNTSDWLLVNSPDQKTGWVSTSVLETTINLADLPEVPTPTTPSIAQNPTQTVTIRPTATIASVVQPPPVTIQPTATIAPTSPPALPTDIPGGNIDNLSGVWKGSGSKGAFVDINVQNGGIANLHFDYPDFESGPDLSGNCPPEHVQQCLGYESWINGMSRVLKINRDGTFQTTQFPIVHGSYTRYLSVEGRFNSDNTVTFYLLEEAPQTSECNYRSEIWVTLYR
ncbi:SH3 domain-containing protein [Herpetosiphon geysericola]|uniref:SH3 domain-containing protein n=1 Tax=Herpetosiphon geysericola TaxID=70996 RepID=UPI0009F9F081|nr:SH3 domain-containing protein [Herpetosiphon geysericola]